MARKPLVHSGPDFLIQQQVVSCNRCRRPDFTYGTKSLETITPIQVSDMAYYKLASNGIKPHGRRRKSQISVDEADRTIARVHGTRYGPLSTKLQWHVALSCIVVVPMHAREDASAIVRRPMHSPLQMRRSSAGLRTEQLPRGLHKKGPPQKHIILKNMAVLYSVCHRGLLVNVC